MLRTLIHTLITLPTRHDCARGHCSCCCATVSLVLFYAAAPSFRLLDTLANGSRLFDVLGNGLATVSTGGFAATGLSTVRDSLNVRPWWPSL